MWRVAASQATLWARWADAADAAPQRKSPRAPGRSCVGCGTVVTTKWTPLGAGFVCDRCIAGLPQERQRRPLTEAEIAAEVQHAEQGTEHDTVLDTTQSVLGDMTSHE